MKINQLILFTTGLCALLCIAFYSPQESITIYLVGDSTMADKPGAPAENPERGWGQLLPVFFVESVKVENHAVNGRSSKSFINEGRWQTILEELQSGDYVFIQFGHNDQKASDSSRYTNPWTGYRRNLEKYVAETKAKGAYPVVLSSIVRRKFNEQGTLVDTHGAYPYVARSVAEAMNVPFIDMQLLTEDYVIALGPEKSKTNYLWVTAGEYDKFPDGKQDDTHLNLEGATAYAGLVASAIKAKKLPLVLHLK